MAATAGRHRKSPPVGFGGPVLALCALHDNKIIIIKNGWTLSSSRKLNVPAIELWIVSAGP